jgi:hypothetical protein
MTKDKKILELMWWGRGDSTRCTREQSSLILSADKMPK